MATQGLRRVTADATDALAIDELRFSYLSLRRTRSRSLVSSPFIRFIPAFDLVSIFSLQVAPDQAECVNLPPDQAVASLVLTSQAAAQKNGGAICRLPRQVAYRSMEVRRGTWLQIG
jgi:hypothetical protein